MNSAKILVHSSLSAVTIKHSVVKNSFVTTINKKLLKYASIVLFNMILLLFSINVNSQTKLIDGVIAIVGNNAILQSDIENQYMQYITQGYKDNPDFKCKLLEELLFQKMLVIQAALDSVNISDAQVEEELDKRIRYFVKQLGSKEKLEEYYHKSLFEIKKDFKETIRDMMLAQTIENKITKDIKVTPSDVKSFYKKIPADSLPFVSSEVEIGHIVKLPLISAEEKSIARDKINSIRERIITGEDFGTLTVMYSDDNESAKNKGEAGMKARGELIPEFESVVFGLKSKEVSPIIERPEGFYIFQLIERKGEYINFRQFFTRLKPSAEALLKAKLCLDTVANLIKDNKITIEQAIAKYSDDPSKNNNGLIVNPQSGTTKFEMDDLDQSVFFIIDKLNTGNISAPVPFITDNNNQAYRIVFLKSRSEPHRANLKDDYDRIQNAALNEKKNQTIDKWITEKTKTTYIKIMNEYKNCSFRHKWIN